MKKKIGTFALAGALAVSLAACSSRPEEPTVPTQSAAQSQSGADEAVADQEGAAPLTGVTLEFLYNLSGEMVSDAIQEVCQQFTYETGIEVEAVMPGSNFSDIMKTRMASNQLPDLFTTHGWAVARYAEYLKPLNELSFAANIMPGIEEHITDSEGNLYTLPIDMDLTGIVYNVNVLSEAGVDPDEIKTWADFEAACEKIKAIGKTPIQMGGKDNWTIGNMMDFVAPTFITNESPEAEAALLDGTFDWSQWQEVADTIDGWREKGYFNTDAITADYMTCVKALAVDQSAFAFFAASGITETYSINPNAEMGFMAMPAKETGGRLSLMSGEHFAVGMWKDSKHQEEAELFLEFLAREDICEKLATVCGMPAGLSNVQSDTGRLAPYYDKYTNSDVLTIPYFDRKYLPSGMWNDLCVTGASILAGQTNAAADSVAQMEQSYQEKMAQ